MSHDSGDHHPAAPLDLLDEYWFFSNTLNSSGKKKKPLPPPPPLPSRSPSTSKLQQGRQELGCRRRLLRTPSLPPPRSHPAPSSDDKELVVEEVVDDDDLNWSSIYEGVLRTRIATSSSSGSRSSSSALQRAPSMPVVPSACKEKEKEKEKKEMRSSHNNNKLRHSYSTLETPSKLSSKQQQLVRKTMMVRSKSTVFHQAADEKKWKSSSDLESMEVQGFKDLGFVFDKEELSEDLADVLPGLSKQHNASGHGAVRRPYLSEAWHHDRRRPTLIRVQSEARSAAEMKDQLRMWAQAVACNVRQECA